MKWFINLSGGIDSTYYLWKFLKENPKEKVLVHHCVYGRVRNEVEKKAAIDIVDWLNLHGYRNFKIVYTKYHKGTVRGSIPDIVVMGALAGLTLRSNGSVENIMLPYCFEETPVIRKHFESGKKIKELNPKHRTGTFIRTVEVIAGREYNFHAMYHMKKKGEMIEEMPPSLVALTWFCRKPLNGLPCQKCFNCKRVLPHLKKKKNESS